MRAGLRFGIAAFAAALALAPAPAPAQEAAPPATNTPRETIGPRELEDFSLNGTVTRPARPAPTRSAPEPRPATRTPRSAPPPETRSAPAPDRPPAPARQPPAPVTDTFTPADPLSAAPAPAPADIGSPFDPQPGFAPAPAVPAGNPADQSPNPVPWLMALLLLGAGAGLYAWRRRSRPSYAAAGGLTELLVPANPEPAPASRPFRPTPTPAPRPAAPPGPAGIVSTRLRPWLEIEFTPARCVVEDEKATIQFDVAVFNSGSAPARDVLVEASLFNAGPSQEQEMGAFFAHPVGKGDRIPAIPPLKRVALKSSVSLAREQLRSFEVAGRHLFVPLVGFNALYRWSGGEGQTSASYLVGRDTDGEKMAPLRLDLGPRIFRGLGAREHSLRVRK